ncbi:MAG TPA: hypothetical protein VGO77_18130 [Mycobacterium sp.]|nr:hypothetical protein [Mycobacterium sp.]
MPASVSAMPDDGEGEGVRTPLLTLNGYNGPLEELLTLARSRRIDLGKIPLLDLVDQLAAAVRDAPPATPMGQKGDWVVMAAWLVQLRSLLLLPDDAPARQAAQDEVEGFRDRLSELAEIQLLATWLDERPRLGRNVFVRGQPFEGSDPAVEATSEIDVIEFLWASMALFDDGTPGPDVSDVYRPRWRDLYSIAASRARILNRLAETPDGLSLDRLLPEEATAADILAEPMLKTRAAWSSTLIAGLELAKQGNVGLAQEDIFAAIHVSPTHLP